MRLKRNRLKSLALKKLQVIKDGEGGTYEEFSPSFCIIDVEVWPATNKRQVELYGVRVNDILNVNYQGNTLIEGTAKNNTKRRILVRKIFILSRKIFWLR